jgi:predicted HTH domain antitoxin
MQLHLEIPDQYAINASPEELAKRFKLYSALMMFKTGQLSAGGACELAEIDRYAFFSACEQHGIDVVGYDVDELDGDFNRLKGRGS